MSTVQHAVPRLDETCGPVAVCRVEDLTPERGVAALVRGRQVALFRIDDHDGLHLFGIDHRDPCSGANVLARGIVGSTGGRWYVASPLHKQRFDLETGRCLDEDDERVGTWRVAVRDGVVYVTLPRSSPDCVVPSAGV